MPKLKAMTTSQLIAKMLELDPEGNMPVALLDSGGQVKPIDEIAVEKLFIHPRDKTFATVGRYMDKPKKNNTFASMKMEQRGNALYLD